ncbi:hypothetical protein [Nocardia vulneris]|uniref:Helix-turn-helix domain-containing protein n=1 Tax=Nocardia vulneris TaxID=1141657 RepID=A0ABR4ZCG9_9NOCA|nr:hypothetical protein [Nocardia vulneris]KIA63052.1 hypothetical protein FG87_22105 [Nocardia vulneris]
MSDDLTPTAAVDIRPITFDLEGAKAYTGLSKWKLETLLREEVICGRKEGAKTLYERESLDRYIKSLPAYGTV